MLTKRVIWTAFGMFTMLLLIVGCTIFTTQPKAVAQQATQEPLVEHTPPEPITMTVTAKSWECLYELSFADAGRFEADRDVPAGAKIVDIINKPEPGGYEYKPWYIYFTEEDRVARRFYSGGFGNDSEPQCRAFNLESNEYVSSHIEAYFIQLEDSTGNHWLWMPYPEFYQRSNFGRVLYPVDPDPIKANEAYREFYMQFEVGQEVLVTDYFSQRGLRDILSMEPAQ